MSDDDWAKNLWSAANAITAFAVAQGLVFGYVLGKDEIKNRITTTGSRAVILVASVIALAIYCLAIYCTGRRGRELDPAHSAIWKETTIGRIIAVVFFTLLPLIALVG